MRASFALLIGAVVLAGAVTAALAGVPARSTVGCDLRIAEADKPYRQAGIVIDQLGLPRGRYPWRIARSGDRVFPFWAKWGILVRSGTGEAVTIAVAKPWRRHATIGWGNGWALSVTFLPCKSSRTWLVYAGAFQLKKLGCVPFVVRAGNRTERIRIGFGRSCSP